MKTKTVFFCKQCGHESPKWMGRCPGCGEWNTLVEQNVSRPQSGGRGRALAADPPVPLSGVGADTREPMATGIGELDRAPRK